MIEQNPVITPYDPWELDKPRLEVLAHKFDKSIKLHNKDNTLMKGISWLLFIFSFGKLKRERFLENFATTLGNHHYYPSSWSIQDVEETLPHEAQHTRQFRWFGFGIHPLAGLPLAGVAYGLIFFPVGIAVVRVLLEIDADKARWRHQITPSVITYTKAGKIQLMDLMTEQARRRSKILAGPEYLWAMPEKSIYKLYLSAYNDLYEEVMGEPNETNMG